MALKFNLIATDGNARRGSVETAHGTFQTPAFMAVGTAATVKALTMALAGTLGVGNIVGVATALYLGGPGAVFWMVFSALIAMVLKYAEICLAVRHRRYHSDGQPEGGAAGLGILPRNTIGSRFLPTPLIPGMADSNAAV